MSARYRRGQPLSWRVNTDGESRRISPPPTHQISDGDTIIDAASSRLGICQMPMSLLRPGLKGGTLVSVLDKVSKDLIDVHVVWPKVAHLRPKVRHVVDTLVGLAAQGALDARRDRGLFIACSISDGINARTFKSSTPHSWRTCATACVRIGRGEAAVRNLRALELRGRTVR
ncbi:LysR substrate-binding domain-containing protein [Paraburkholderia sp. CNPSo 3272]|uniref:LysR substrate-binding domain-containing protein n=1 Tax=Paraburkholderia sp. CNPSo 3272 TaxID=2940931 RepID=UPI0020B815E1|nr:LysR substrate-binding domain-containing protein [Paraburkholderia sp. CNPSo 3272]MCP3722421.1 LysR substrate-binding domain-containing protein [Paraburkholderia sp. CNPSo 3272]